MKLFTDKYAYIKVTYPDGSVKRFSSELWQFIYPSIQKQFGNTIKFKYCKRNLINNFIIKVVFKCKNYPTKSNGPK